MMLLMLYQFAAHLSVWDFRLHKLVALVDESKACVEGLRILGLIVNITMGTAYAIT